VSSLKKAALLFIILFIITGFVYPFTVTLIAGLAFPFQAHGSLIIDNNGRVIGSTIIGQNFTGTQYFQSRPSASGYNPAASGGSNIGPTNPILLELIANRTDVLRKTGITGPIPSDLVTASASGLDPHISLESALIQVPAVAKARSLPEEEVRKLVLSESIDPPFSGSYVNVLSLNLALDEKNHIVGENYGNGSL
jgi:K+-transporting ATPase ATPase C chain